MRERLADFLSEYGLDVMDHHGGHPWLAGFGHACLKVAWWLYR